MKPPIDTNAQIAALKLERLGFMLTIGWQSTIKGCMARWRRLDTFVTLILEGKRLTVVTTSATDHRHGAPEPSDGHEVVQALEDAGVTLIQALGVL
jgi:hypothetical protein